jgi:acyl-CoA synthetase (AMP-forming)/AMP-acid ligase II
VDFNIAQVHEAIAAAIPERECIVFRDRRLSFAEVNERTRQLANGLTARGLGLERERGDLEPHESGQDFVALLLLNGPEYLEGMVGAYKARTVPMNVNYRYVADELSSLLNDAGATAIIYHDCFAPVLAAIRDQLPHLRVLIQVADESGEALLEGATEYEEFLAGASPERPDLDWSPDDLYVAYTGGTTGPPKGVLWRQADIYAGAMGGADPASGDERKSLDEIVGYAAEPRIHPYLIAAPLMHAAGHWLAFLAWAGGDPVVLSPVADRLDAKAVLRTIETEKAAFIIVVGNAFGRPLLDEIDAGEYDLSSLKILSTGGTAMTAEVKEAFLKRRPGLRVIDSIGSSESGAQGRHVATSSDEVAAGVFWPGPGTGLLAEDHSGPIRAEDGGEGWLARSGRIPLGYLGDADKTAATFPEIDGVRYSIPGDRARWNADGSIKLLGRDSVCINTGGEKVFVEEVEAALHSYPGVADVIVVGRPSERWGSEVVAVVAASAPLPTFDQLVAHSAERLARYKLPKEILFVDQVERGPNGKPDYGWAAEIAVSAEGQPDR